MLIRIGRKLKLACGYSCTGLRFAWKEDFAFRLEVKLSIVLIPLALWLGHTKIEKAILLLVWMLVPLVELINSAIENAIDRISKDLHPISQRAKDKGSAAVLVASVICTLIWSIIIFAR